MKKLTINDFAMILTSLVAVIAFLILLISLVPNRLRVVDSDDQTLFTATILEIVENDDSIYIRLDFHDHTVFYSDTFIMDVYNYKYAVAKGFLDEVKTGDTITIMTNPNNGPYYYYEIFSLKKDDKVYLTVQESNEGLKIENDLEDARSKKIIIICGGVVTLFTLATVINYRFQIKNKSLNEQKL